MEFIFNQIFKLKGTQEPIPFSAVPEPLQNDFKTFIQYRAILKRNGQYYIQPTDFKEWLQKLNKEGVDYDINLSHYESSSAPAA
jgi:hypothetical protein